MQRISIANGRPRRRYLVATLVAAMTMGAASESMASDGGAQAWKATRTQAYTSADARFDGYAEDKENVSVVVSLKLRNKEALDNYTRDLFRPRSLVFHRFLDKKQSAATFAPTQEQAQEVADYLAKQGFTNVHISENRLLVTADGNVGVARKAFRTTIARFSRNGVAGIANDSDVQVPESLPQVDQVLGLDTVNPIHTHSLDGGSLKPAYTVLTNGGHGYRPHEFATVYHAGSTPAATDTTVAVIGWGDMANSANDLKRYQQDEGFTVTPTSVVNTSGRTTNDDTGQGEWSMDAQAIAGVSGGPKKLIFYTSGGNASYNFLTGRYNPTGNSNAALLKAINRAVSDNEAKVIDMSWGASECGTTSPGFANSAFQLGVAQGQTFVASSGDNGAYPCVIKGQGLANGAYGDRTRPSVGYPASSPYVVGVGGTTLNTSVANVYTSESSWPYSGGGTSGAESRPSWQTGSGAYRQVPDVAFDADWDKSPVRYYLTSSTTSGVNNSGYYYNGGTSLAAPLFAGIWARLQTANGNRLGFAAPAIYAYASSQDERLPLQDITTGNNGKYDATAGWDSATGWGSFDIEAVKTFIANTPGFIDASNALTSNP
ncbi:MAG: Pseudomonalisin [Luteibacter sp.]|uniref:S53 family peptidase n=1 Tax=Luteibacter sp. TaxID=1886636 RepID=UPI0013808B02|nr:S53 family peptidase [Luteibacter sp.]KAF1006192.1 MAG: Pseudomonalisin [Luteibacter sp.]